MTPRAAGAYLEGAVADNAYVQHLTRGGELLRADRVDEARSELERARELRPGDARILNLLGLAYFRLGQYHDAHRIYADLVKRQPEDASMRLNLGLVHLKMGRVDEAIVELVRARDLDPSQARTVGYLGLAYARKGEYALAREAFLEAGQEDLAREMEQYLGANGSAPPVREGGVAPSGDGVAAAAGSAPAVEVVEAAAESRAAEDGAAAEPTRAVGSAAAAAAVAASGDTSPADTIPTPAPVAEAAPADGGPAPAGAAPSDGVVQPARDEGVVTAAVRLATLPTPVTAISTGEGHRAPESVTAFATARLIRPDDGDLPFEIAAGDTLIVRVRGRVLSRTEGVIVSGGELAYEPAVKRVRGRMTEEPFGQEARPMFFVSGHGHLIATPRGGRFTALRLADDILYVREDLVFAFEERLRWENGHVPGSGGGIHVVQFRGEGCVAVRTRRAPLLVKLAPDKVLYVDADVLMGWIGRVVPRVVAPVAGGDASTPFVECTGEGVVLVEEPDPPQAV